MLGQQSPFSLSDQRARLLLLSVCMRTAAACVFATLLSTAILGCAAARAEPINEAEDAALEKLGIALHKNEAGRMVVHAVQDGSPADRADVQRGDVVLLIDESPVIGRDDLSKALDKKSQGHTVRLTLSRNQAVGTVTLHVRQPDKDGKFVAPPGDEAFMLGMCVARFDDAATVTEVTPTSPAWKAGIRQGDKILKLDMFEPESFEDLLDGARKFVNEQDRKSLPITLDRNGEEFVANVDLAPLPEPAEREQDVRVVRRQQGSNGPTQDYRQPTAQNRFLYNRGGEGFVGFQERSSDGAVAILYQTGSDRGLNNSTTTNNSTNSSTTNNAAQGAATPGQNPNAANDPLSGLAPTGQTVAGTNPATSNQQNLNLGQGIVGRVLFRSGLDGTTVYTQVSGLKPGRYIVALHQQADTFMPYAQNGQNGMTQQPAANAANQGVANNNGAGNQQNLNQLFNNPGQQANQNQANQNQVNQNQPAMRNTPQNAGGQQPLLTLSYLTVNYQGNGMAGQNLPNIPVVNLIGLMVAVHPVDGNPTGTAAATGNTPATAQGNGAGQVPPGAQDVNGNPVVPGGAPYGNANNPGASQNTSTGTPMLGNPVATGVIGFAGANTFNQSGFVGATGNGLPQGQAIPQQTTPQQTVPQQGVPQQPIPQQPNNGAQLPIRQ